MFDHGFVGSRSPATGLRVYLSNGQGKQQRAQRRTVAQPVVMILVTVLWHSPHKESVLVLRIDDPEFFDCCFQC
jgi:hypothetical protein